jgi:hypothetical protein
MTANELSRFLAAWSADILATLRQLPEEYDFSAEERCVLESGTMIRPPAKAYTITKAERRLHCKLPNSYRQFLLFSNGLWMPSFDQHPGETLPVAQIGPFAELYPQSYTIFSEMSMHVTDAQYDRYGSSQDPVHFRTRYGPSLIAITTNYGSGLYLLNPEVTFSGDEWEAWSFNFHGGADRFKSFDELLVSERTRTVAGYRELLG